MLCFSDLTIDEEDEEEIIERRRKERQALMSKLNGGQNSSTDKTPATKMFEVVSAGTELIDDDRESEDDDNGDADSNNGFDMVSDESPGKYPQKKVNQFQCPAD